MMLELGTKLSLTNPGFFHNKDLLTMTTSIDSLAPDCPIFNVMLRAPHASWTTYHNIMGQVARRTLIGRVSDDGDGIVTLNSARVKYAATELVIEADHMTVHRHPLAILEVRRILLEHVSALGGPANFGPSAQLAPPQLSLAGPQPALR
jgi:hypothetical protein